MTFRIPRARRPTLRSLPLPAAVGLGSLVLLGFLGGLLPPFDTIGQMRAHASLLLAAAALALFACRRPGAGLAALGVAALGLASVMPFMLPANPVSDAAPGAPRYTLLQMNLRFDASDPAATLSLIARVRPDIVTVQEITPPWHEALERLQSAYPYRAYCQPQGGTAGDVAILSRRPFIQSVPGQAGEHAVCDGGNRFVARTVDFNGLPVTVASQHLRWPWPGAQPAMVRALSPTLSQLNDPTIVAGDFNAAPWSAAVRRYARESRTRVLAGIGPTWLTKLLPASLIGLAGLPLDNVLVSDSVEILDVRALAPTSSDHLPVLVSFTMRFALPEEPDVRSASR